MLMDFVPWFRAAAPYIHAFRGQTFVIAFGGEVVSDGKFTQLTHDLNLLQSLGVRLVLVHGARPQIERLLTERGIISQYHHGMRCTDSATLLCVKQAIGQVRTDIEALLSMGLANSPMAGATIRVNSGNFVTAKPVGVLDGLDLQYTGTVRTIHHQAIQKNLEDDEMVLLSPLGYSPTGETFNLTLEAVAQYTAIALKAHKLIFLGDTQGVQKDTLILSELTAQQAEEWLANHPNADEDMRLYLPCAIQAVRQGVERAHLISRHIDGGLLQELFTHNGIGSMITRDPLAQMRQATIEDVGGILCMLEPLEKSGVLVKRSRERLEMEISQFHVLTHDNMIVGCVAMYAYPDYQMGELACLVVHPDYRRHHYGERLLTFIEQHACEQGFTQIFALTTQTAHWFIEKGFCLADITDLPSRKQVFYNHQRKSQVFIKSLRPEK